MQRDLKEFDRTPRTLQERVMMMSAIPFRDYAASRIAKTLLAVFFTRTTLVGAQFSFQEIVYRAYQLADRLEEQKQEDIRLNELALTLLEGMLFGFYENRKEHKNWSSMVHVKRIPLLIRDAYRIAALMVTQSEAMTLETSTASTHEPSEPPPATQDPE